MTPLIALDLSLDGIVVMSRAPAGPDRGKWLREGVVRLDDEDLSGQLHRMRARCAARVGDDFTSILVIPDSQILFTSLERDDRSAKATIRALLKGRTPYPVEDLTFDFVERGDRLQVAVVALDTLLEAEAFASGFGFRPVALVGNPKDSPYPGIPDFGPTGGAADLLGGEPLMLDLDQGFTVLPAPARPDPEVTPDAAPEPSAAPPGAKAAAEPAAVHAVEPIVEPTAEFAAVPVADPPDFASVIAATPDAPAPAIAPPPDSEAPAFSTRRRAPAARATPAGPALTRITPRLSRPAPVAASEAGPVVAPMPAAPEIAPQDEPTDPPAHATQPDLPTPAPPSRIAALSALARPLSRAAKGLGRASASARSLRARLPKRSASAASSAEAADSPIQTARGAAAPPSRRTASSRLGLYLTLSLLALLGIVAIGSLALRDDDVSTLAASGGVPIAGDPAPTPGADGTGTDDTSAGPASPGNIAAPPPAGPIDDDLALLLPDSQGSAAPAALLEGEPEENANESVAPSDVGPEIAVVTIDAEPFELPRDFADAPEPGSAEEIYVASIDPVIAHVDAIALPRAEPPADAFSSQTSPPSAGTDFDTGSDGLVVASAAGTLAPGGYSVIAGRPATLPAPRPGETPVQLAEEAADEDAARTGLGGVRPTPRPEDAPVRVERLTFGGLTREELTRTLPVRRPGAITETAARAEAAAARQSSAVRASAAVASLARTDTPADIPEPDQPGAASQARFAVAQSGRPRERPRSVEQDAARIVTERREPAAPAAVVASAGSTSRQPALVESSRQTLRSAGGSVSRAATQSNQIRLREMNLIGVYGRPNSRRALVRLSNGRYVKIEVGDRLERGRVTAIGESEVIYQQSGRTYALRMPQT